MLEEARALIDEFVSTEAEKQAASSARGRRRSRAGRAAVDVSPENQLRKQDAGPRSGAMRHEVGKPRLYSPTVGFDFRCTRLLIVRCGSQL